MRRPTWSVLVRRCALCGGIAVWTDQVEWVVDEELAKLKETFETGLREWGKELGSWYAVDEAPTPEARQARLLDLKREAMEHLPQYVADVISRDVRVLYCPNCGQSFSRFEAPTIEQVEEWLRVVDTVLDMRARYEGLGTPDDDWAAGDDVPNDEA